MLKEFKDFISKGNVIDLAVGVIIGGAFGKIITSVVNDIIMPLVGLVLGGVDFSTLMIKIGESEIKYGAFLQNVVDFLIVALCIFFFVKVINKFFKKKKNEEIAIKKEELVVLEEIRDLLKTNKKAK